MSKIVRQILGEAQDGGEPKPVILREKSYTVWWCPHCDTEILEKHSYPAQPDAAGSLVEIHSDCGKPFLRPKVKCSEVPDWLMPHMHPDVMEP